MRWDKAHKKAEPKHKARKENQATRADHAEEFQVPSVGYVFSGSVSTDTGAVNKVQTGQQPQKSFRTLLHQRANKIGRVEARIKKLEGALNTVQTTWPAYLQQATQKLEQEHAKCVAFQERATTELRELQQELQQLMTQQIAPVDPPIEAVQYPVTPNAFQQPNQYRPPKIPGFAMQDTAPQVMEVDSMTTGAFPGFSLPYLGEVQQPVQTMHPSINVGGLPSASVGVGVPVPASVMSHMSPMQPSIGPAMMPQPQVPDRAPSSTVGAVPGFVPSDHPGVPSTSQPQPGPQIPVEAPPGNWETPPTSPQVADHSDEPAQFPNPLYRPPAPVLPVQTATDAERVTADAPPEVRHIIADAVQAMHLLPIQQGGTGGNGLTSSQQQQLQLFAQQQQEAHQKMQALQQAFPVKPKGQVKIAAFDHAPVTCQSPEPNRIHDGTWSVHSSPGVPHTQGMLHHQQGASPKGQRQMKIAKNAEGDVHLQTSIATPVPTSPGDSPVSPKSPTPVPTEVATEVGEDLEELG